MAVPIVADLPLAGIAAAPLALAARLAGLRVRGPYFVILTFGVAEFIKYIVVTIEAGARPQRPPADWNARLRSFCFTRCWGWPWP